MTELVAPVAEGTSTTPVQDGGTVYMTIEYRSDLNGGLKEGFWLREFGVYAKTAETDEILLYYATLGDSPQPVNPLKDGRVDIRRYPISISSHLTSTSRLCTTRALLFPRRCSEDNRADGQRENKERELLRYDHHYHPRHPGGPRLALEPARKTTTSTSIT